MVSYDPNIIEGFAEKLYSRADAIVLGWTVCGALAGFVAGSLLGGEGYRVAAIFLGGAIGYAVGVQRAFLLKLQAQLALCQVQIERNTRADVESAIPVGGE